MPTGHEVPFHSLSAKNSNNIDEPPIPALEIETESENVSMNPII